MGRGARVLANQNFPQSLREERGGRLHWCIGFWARNHTIRPATEFAVYRAERPLMLSVFANVLIKMTAVLTHVTTPLTPSPRRYGRTTPTILIGLQVLSGEARRSFYFTRRAQFAPKVRKFDINKPANESESCQN